MENLETVEAFTEKPDGRRCRSAPSNIITRDAASGLPATYMRDLKQRTVIFQDVQVGDTLVMTHTKETRQGLFPGQFYYADVFPRSQPFGSARVMVEAPDDVELQVKTIGNGLTERSKTAAASAAIRSTLRPQSYLPEKVRAVAPIDRDPALLVSTFKSYREMGLAYARRPFRKPSQRRRLPRSPMPSPKGSMTGGQQAMAIDAWMKKNIRYVAVYLALGRVVPNDAARVLRNKYGDCKDKATLMSALLAAKGIASEAVLINFGAAYTLPEPPTMAVLNHVILYLPEFDLYDDPTAKSRPSAYWTAENYDKPVVRIGTSGAILARTPAMRPEDHTAHARTTIHVAADGTVTGRTEESNTGIFGNKLRLAGANIQNLGSEAAHNDCSRRYQHTRYRPP